MNDTKAFTLKGTSILRELKTSCSVSIAHHIISGEIVPESFQFICLWDTGATSSVISKAVANKLGLKPSGKSKVYHSDGESIVNTYLINLVLPNMVIFQLLKVTEGIFNDFDILIGMDIITNGDFSITNLASKTTFSFRVPSINEIDFLIE